MQRRSVLKSLAALAGSSLAPALSLSAQAPTLDPKLLPGTPLATPIRALTTQHGRPAQPIEISLHHTGPATEIRTLLNGTELDRRSLAPGPNTFLVFTGPVSAPTHARLEVRIGTESSTRDLLLKPVRELEIYLLPHSHHDLGYTDLQADVETKQINNILQGIDLARKTSTYPEGSRFVWNLEVLWGADLFFQRRPAADQQSFIEAVQKGWLGLNGMYANELTGLCRPEELLRLCRFGTTLAQRCSVPLTSAMASDVPGFTWGTVSSLAQAGIRYFSTAPNYFDRIGRLMLEWQDRPFWWVSPSGRERVLTWIPWTGYALSHIAAFNRDLVSSYQDRLDSVSYPYSISYLRWSGHGDNAAPDPDLPELIRQWNEQFTWPRFRISTTHDAFHALEARHGGDLPVLRGDLTPFWEDGAGSSAQETLLSRNAADRLTQAETLSTLLAPSAVSNTALDTAWKDVLLYSEHTWGAWCSVSDSESAFTKDQWAFKKAFADRAASTSEALLQKALAAYAPSSPSPKEIDIHNSTSWPRSGLVLLSRDLSSAGDRVSDTHGHPVPSQRLSTGELAVLVPEVPGFGSLRLRLASGTPHPPAHPVTLSGGVLQNGIVRVAADPHTGNLVDLTLLGTTGNLLSSQEGDQGNAYLFLSGGDTSKLQPSGPATLTAVESGPLVATLRISSSAPGCNSLTRTLRLAAMQDFVELTNTLDKQRAPLLPRPEPGMPTDFYAQRLNKESIQFSFPFQVPSGQVRLDIPLAVMRPEADQLPGSAKNWFPVGRWADVSNDRHGVTLVTLDAPLLEVGAVTANMIGSQRDPSVWREFIEPTQQLFSWVMNNHWSTNYRAYQQGVVSFRYALRPHTAFSSAEASRLGVAQSQPLLASPARAGSLLPPPVHVQSEDVLAISLRPSADGKASMLTLFNSSGQDTTATLAFPSGRTPQLFRSNTAELPLAPLSTPSIPVAGFEVLTLRLEHGGQPLHPTA